MGAISKQPMQKFGFLREGRTRSTRPKPPNGTKQNLHLDPWGAGD
jgi:hypothetical protein